MEKIIAIATVIGILLGGIDYLLGNKYGFGKRFVQGFEANGSMMLSMAGLMSIVPVIAAFLKPVIVSVNHFFGIDPGMIGIITSCDMGGYQLAKSLAEDPRVIVIAGMVLAGAIGGALTFCIPMGYALLEKKDIDKFLKGATIGLITTPISGLVAGLALGMPLKSLILNLLPVLVVTILLGYGFKKHYGKIIRILNGYGKVIKTIGVIGIIIGAIEYTLDKKSIPSLTPIMDSCVLVCEMTLILIGMFPFIEFFIKVFRKPLEAIGNHFGLEPLSCTCILFAPVSGVPVFPAMKDMSDSGMVVNSAWLISIAGTLGSQMALVVSVDTEMLTVFLLGKFSAALVTLIVVYIIEQPRKKKVRVIEMVNVGDLRYEKNSSTIIMDSGTFDNTGVRTEPNKDRIQDGLI